MNLIDEYMKYRHIENTVKNNVSSMPGGTEAFAAAVGSKSVGVIRNAINPDCETNHFTFQHFLKGVDMGIFDDVLRMIVLRRGFALDQINGELNVDHVVDEAVGANLQVADMLKLAHLLKNNGEIKRASKKQIKELLTIAFQAENCLERITASLSKELSK